MGHSRTIELLKTPPGPRSRVAVGYCRRSTDRQEQSIPDQRAAIERAAKERSFALARLYIDDARTGTTTIGRRAFQQMVKDAEQPNCPFAWIVVYDVKRFGRGDNDEAGYFRHILKTHGVNVVYTSENFTGDRSDDLVRSFKQWQAQEESRDLAKVTVRGLISRATEKKRDDPSRGAGWWNGGAPPFGYDLRYESSAGEFLFYLRYIRNGSKQVFDRDWNLVRTIPKGETVKFTRKDRAKLVLSEPLRVAVVQRIFKMFVAECRGFKSIADALNNEGIPSMRTGEWCAGYGGWWNMTGVRGLLCNPVYSGDMVWNRRTDGRFYRITKGGAVERNEVKHRRLTMNEETDWFIVRDAHEPIVDRRLFEAARHLLKRKQACWSQRDVSPPTGQPAVDPVAPQGAVWRGYRAKFLLSGLMICARCGSRYQGRQDWSKKSGKYVYGCGAYIRCGRAVCALGPVPKVPLEDAVVASVTEFYSRYTGPSGSQKIRKALEQNASHSHRDLCDRRESLKAVMKKIDATTANLLDNITAINRELVDNRIIELRKQREVTESELAVLDHLSFSAEALQAFVTETSAFIKQLNVILREGLPDARNIALRRCIALMEVDALAGHADMKLRIVPYIGLRSAHAATETILVRWDMDRTAPRYQDAKTTHSEHQGPGS